MYVLLTFINNILRKSLVLINDSQKTFRIKCYLVHLHYIYLFLQIHQSASQDTILHLQGHFICGKRGHTFLLVSQFVQTDQRKIALWGCPLTQLSPTATGITNHLIESWLCAATLSSVDTSICSSGPVVQTPQQEQLGYFCPEMSR